MSQDIVCTECQFENPAGSKFCSNCGSKLPLGTHIICSNCGTKNTIDRIFCDHCGTRLIPDDSPAEEEKPAEPPASGKAFTLPSRKPGDTGDLDPQNVLDWMKSVESGKHEIPEDFDEEDLPRVEELTEKDQQTGDLPEWLVDEEDSDPIIHAPTVISTEFYKDLLDKVEDAPEVDDLFEEDDDSKLPDWLQDAGTEPLADGEQPPSEESTKGLTEFLEDVSEQVDKESGQDEATSESLTSWLSDASEEEDAAIAADKESAGLTEWLSDAEDVESGQTEAEIDDESLTNWLADKSASAADPSEPAAEDEGLTEWFESSTSPAEAEEPEEVISEESLTSWLSDDSTTDELDEPSTGLTEWLAEEPEAAEEAPAAEPVEEDISESLTSWLAELPDDDEEEETIGEADEKSLTEWFSEEPETSTEKKEVTSEFSESLTGWLSELPDDEEEETAVGAEDEFVEDEDFSSRLSDWLADGEDDSSEADYEEAPAAEELEETELTDWLADADEAGELEFEEPAADELATDEALTSRLSDWLPADSGEETDEVEDEDTSLAPDAVAAWMSDESEEEAAEEKEQFDWLEDPEAPVTASGKHEIPSEVAWLEETEEELSNIFQSQPTIEEELPDWLADVADEGDSFVSETDEEEVGDLEDIFKAEQKAVETELDFLQQTGSLSLDSDWARELGLDDEEPDSEALSELIGTDEPDWLSDLAQMDSGELRVPEEEELDAAVADLSQSPAEESEEEAEPLLTPAESLAAADGADEIADEFDGEDEDEPFSDSYEEELPDWIEQLDSTDDTSETDDSELIPSDELPDWVASLKPGQEDAKDSVLPGALSEDLPETLAGIPEELAGSDLPEWLRDVPKTPAEEAPIMPVSEDREGSDIPDWLQPGLDQTEEETEIFGTSDSAMLDPTPVSDEWGAILNDLPPAVPIEETLSKAEIPEWVMDLKPAELTGEAPKTAPVPEGPEETHGPLSGLRGVVTVEPVIAQPRSAAAPVPFAVSPEQHQQVLMLQQLAQNGIKKQKGKTKRAGRDISGWTRPLFALILILVIVVGWQGILPLDLPAEMPAPVVGMNTAVSDAAGDTVLVAFEYSPAMAGELTPEAETLLAQLAENESNILTISQYAAGVPIAESVIANTGVDAINLGYLPGGTIGLRRLAECLKETSQAEDCRTMFDRPLTSGQQVELESIGLIIVLTANRENLVGWIEQVGKPTEKPMVAGVTQSLNPVTSPYYDTQQLLGVLNGVPGTAVYQNQFFMSGRATDVAPLFEAQVTAEMLLVVVLLLGTIIYLISGFVAQRRQK